MIMKSVFRGIFHAVIFTILLSSYSICMANDAPQPIFTIKYGELCNGVVNK